MVLAHPRAAPQPPRCANRLHPRPLPSLALAISTWSRISSLTPEGSGAGARAPAPVRASPPRADPPLFRVHHGAPGAEGRRGGRLSDSGPRRRTLAAMERPARRSRRPPSLTPDLRAAYAPRMRASALLGLLAALAVPPSAPAACDPPRCLQAVAP